MIRTIPLKIQNEYITGDKGMIGAAGSHNDVILRMEFSGMWDGLTKMVQFRDALGEATIEVLLTADMLEADDTSVYLVPVPSGAKKYAGEMTLCIKGAAVSAQKETRATLAVYGRFTVAESKWSADAETETDVPASNVEQLQGQIDNVLTTIVDARKAATEAAKSAEGAAWSQSRAQTSEKYAGEYAQNAADSATSAANSATRASDSAASAAESIKHAPRINSYGKWELWDATKNAYVATEYTAIGEDGVRGRGWYQHNVGTSLVQAVVWDGSLIAPKWGKGDWLYNPDNGNVGLCTSRTDNADGSGRADINYKGTLKGTDGITPTIGTNGNWYIGDTDTGVKAAAEAATHETAGVVKPGYDFDIAADGTLSLYKSMEILSIKMNDIKPTGSYPLYILYEKGTKLTGFVVAWELNKVPMQQTFQVNVVGNADLDEMDIGTTARSTADLSGEQLEKWAAFANKEYTILSAFATLQFVLKATDARGKSATKLLHIHAYNGVYTGAASSPDVIDAVFLNTLKKSVADGYARTFTVDAKAGQYIWYACPTKFVAVLENNVTPTFNVGGFDGGFSKVATFDFTNSVGYTEEYQVWRSDNAGLGSTTVKVS